MQETFDVVVVGSGAGGAPLAYTLAKEGKTVCVLEKGPWFLPEDRQNLSGFKRDELFAAGSAKVITLPDLSNSGVLYYSSHVEPDLNDEPHIYFSGKRDYQGRPLDYATIEGYTAQVVGGGTQLYGGVSLRFPERDFCLKKANEGRYLIANPDPNSENGNLLNEVLDWPISYQDLEPYYQLAEKLVGLNGEWAAQQGKPNPYKDSYQPTLDPNPISTYVRRGMDKLGMEAYRTPLAVITRHYPARCPDEPLSERHVPDDPETIKSGYINRYGDPLGYKSSTWVAFLRPVSDRSNLCIRANCVVTGLECAKNGSKGKITKVHYLDPSGKPRFVCGETVVVACSAIETVRLLLLSALQFSAFSQYIFPEGNKANQLPGKYFLSNCFGGASVLVPDDRYDKSISLDSDWATDYCTGEEFLEQHHLWAGGVIYNNTSDQALPLALARTYGATDLDKFWDGFNGDMSLTGRKLHNFLDQQFGKNLSITFMANEVPLKSNRIELHSRIKDKWGRPVAYIIKDWHSHDRFLMDTLAFYCAKILSEGTGVPLRKISSGGVYLGEEARPRIANHILGGARFGTDPKDSVLNPNCRVWNFENLYVTDGAFMPTSGGANPTLTIQANSLRVANFLLRGKLDSDEPFRERPIDFYNDRTDLTPGKKKAVSK